jgi:hypothetical protein
MFNEEEECKTCETIYIKIICSSISLLNTAAQNSLAERPALNSVRLLLYSTHPIFGNLVLLGGFVP